MGPSTSKVSPPAGTALRSKQQVLMEEWGTTDQDYISNLQFEGHERQEIPIKAWSKLKLPYQAPSCPPLPSWEYVWDQRDQHSQHSRVGNHSITRFGDTLIKFSGCESIIDEAENLLFLVKTRPQLRIPKVWAVWAVPVRTAQANSPIDIYCIMMDFIDGIILESESLAKLPTRTQDIISAKVSAQIRYLRSLPSEGYYGRIYRQSWVHPPMGLRVVAGAVNAVSGPYNTYEEFCSAINRSYELQSATCTGDEEFHPTYEADTTRFRSIFPDWDPHEPKFTWIDPKLNNLIARPIKGDAGEEDWEVFIIDWELAGWYPAWVQALQFKFRCGAFLRRPNEASKSSSCYPLIAYREDEIIPQMLKDFDPNPDWRRMKLVREADWIFY